MYACYSQYLYKIKPDVRFFIVQKLLAKKGESKMQDDTYNIAKKAGGADQELKEEDKKDA